MLLGREAEEMTKVKMKGGGEGENKDVEKTEDQNEWGGGW